MGRIAAIVGLILAVSACAGTTGTGAGELAAGTISAGGRERDFLLYRPPGVDSLSDPRPLVIVFHGGGGTARGIAREVGDTLHALADRDGFFVAYPDAVDRTWDFGAGVVSEALDERVDDTAFFATLVDQLVATLPIDRDRVFATGISRGGQASWFVACRFPGRIRAIAPVAMPMPVFMQDFCGGARDIGVAILNGTEDPLVPYDGGQIRVGRRERGEVLSTDETVRLWRTKNGCDAAASETRTIDTIEDGMQVIYTAWESCERSPVVLYRVERGGHTWPSGRQYLPRFLVGPVNRDIDAAEEIWAFFSRFR